MESKSSQLMMKLDTLHAWLERVCGIIRSKVLAGPSLVGKPCVCVLPYTLVLFIFLLCPTPIQAETYTIGYLADISKGTELKFFSGAIEVAIQRVAKDVFNNTDIELKYDWDNIGTSVITAISVMTKFREENVTAFIGPSKVDCLTEAVVATAWNLPMLSYKCQDKIVNRPGLKESTPTFARTIPAMLNVAKYIMSIMNYYKWKRCAIVYFKNKRTMKSGWQETVNALTDIARENELVIVDTIEMESPYYSRTDINKLQEVYMSTKDKTRVYIFLGDQEALIDFVRCKHKESKDTNEKEYVFLAVTGHNKAKVEEKEDVVQRLPEQAHEDPLSQDHIDAFRNVLLIYNKPATNEEEYAKFQKEAYKHSVDKFGMRKVPPGINISNIITLEAAYLYDAVYLYARTVSEAHAEGIDVRNGSAMAEKMKNRSYRSILGYDIFIDENGDSMANYSLYAIQRPAEGDYHLQNVGSFRPVNNSPAFKEIGPGIQWIEGIPKSEPDCGLDGSECIPIDWRYPVLSSIGAIILVVVLAIIFLGRHYRYEQKLASLLWKIDFKDLIITDADFNDPMLSEKPKRKSSARQSLLSGVEDCHKDDSKLRFAGVRVASYKGQLVAVRVLRRRHVEVTRAMRKELQVLKELVHDNVNRFIGACIEPPNICIATQYCSRGSLKDILENDDLNLDEMFIASLVSDLIRGMIFIHDSEVISHGNLKSSNCLVDSRWVLQISDMGLHQLRGCEVPSMLDEDTYYGRLLWRAPELLRAALVPPAGTQKGDVFSFAIILFEIHGRCGPWGPTMYTSREIIEKLKYPPGGAILRPDTSLLKCDDFIIQNMQECWRESPEGRPDFKFIRLRLKAMQKGMKPNIFDNMLAMMEKYADNLEAIVAARTEQLEEEKKKTETLLHRMLPKTVAEQLKKGHIVIPEDYNAVTIYFSDIVGFTAISAESTPMQVVDMLNDLYTCFDSIIGEYDVYKVETIGDAYMVVSGLPIRNGDNHAGEVASMSLHLLRAIKDFQIRHRPSERLNLRIGLHSGSVVAGVVGLKMPRYCLFGDTVNTTSRLESTGIPLKIHCSPPCRDILVKLGGYILEERGLIPMKGKGEMFTYFLTGEDKSHRLRRISVEKQPICTDLSYYNNGPSRLSTPISIRTQSTPSLRSIDSGAQTDAISLIVNGTVPSLKREFSGSLESQV